MIVNVVRTALQGATLSFALLNPPPCAHAQSTNFKVAQSMHYEGGVDLIASGVPRNPIVYESSLLPDRKKNDYATDASMRAALAQLEKGPFPTVLDVERWPLLSGSKNERSVNLKRLLALLQKVRQTRPDMRYGYYGVVPHRIYWPLIDAKRQSDKRAWQRDNSLAEKDLIPLVDAVFPSLYTMYKDRGGWERYATETLQAAKALGKPVYCFLWPQYHDSNSELKGQYIPRDYWRLQLETCRKHAHGIVIWNYEPLRPWDPMAEWWLETVEFLKTLPARPVS